MTDKTNESNVQSFIVKIWIEKPTGQRENLIWRGNITHVVSGERHYVKSLDEITNYFHKVLTSLAVQSGPEPPEAPKQENETPPTPVPIGMPVSPDKYRQLKREAEVPDDVGEQASHGDVFEDSPKATTLDAPVSPVEDQQFEKHAEQPDEEEGLEDTTENR